MRNLTNQAQAIQPLPTKTSVEPYPVSSPAGHDIIGQFQANLKQVGELQKKLNFMVREVDGLVKSRKR
ncbi:MAG: hypothetical protein CL677_05950 [Bdellovibrionaceae bacterium]|nr:hypothetical protein [Pseudobdellovibrionaceae bacterium]|tara:strand:+ start:137636 stop:137839 length:204 start_codon:yes stop_codon:yes gene_type:complete